MTDRSFQFQSELPSSTAAEIARLEADGYLIHKEWINGVELRKGKPFRVWLLVLHAFALLIFPVLLVPGLMRSAVDNLFGYKYRVFVTRDSQEAAVFLV
ncbi:MAG TPA: hypothetical protein VIF60_15255 [Burkholderiaceae bacterium]|jgi:hypothetical protein